MDAESPSWFVGDAELVAFIDHCREVLYREVPEYAGVPQADLLAGITEAVRAAAASFAEDRPPTPAELEVVARIGAARARSGVPFSAFVHGARTAAALAQEVIGTEPSRLWPWIVQALEVASEAHRQVELEIMREDRYRRAAFLTDLFGSRLGGARLTKLAAEFGLDPGEHYAAFRARIPGAEARRRFEAGVDGAGLAESHQGELVGLIAHRPRLEGDGLVAMGQRMPLASASFSFAQASTVLRVSSAFGMTGVVHIEDVPLLAAVLESPNLTGLVTERCFGAIPAAQRDLFTETLTAYLDRDLHIAEAAAKLHVHPNTLRYRIRRFEELSGLHLERVDDLVTVWWALQYERITDAAQAAP
ncbi:PucR-like helix-turn-helix protein [Actinocorallia herbida]|uniref:PucR-like helix-turn-helix protein n=1 Tax=Actinocorallia herbida TaxID=58109 RepID=A0A3N1D7N4_9ACTN|nr:helix-turn-helix domain-containing protein [Actinocorallia herbida]ROO89491.1 PucR-like helix-turn-helix protein [Actinocorallia herbida]